MKFNLKRITVLLIFLTLILNGCGQNQETETVDHDKENEHVEGIQLSDGVINEFGIELATVGPGQLKISVSLPGEIIIPPDNLAHIYPRFAGIVKKVNKHIGDKVNKGDVLAIIESNESLAEYEIKSLISGTLVEKHLSLGEVVEDSEHGFVVADLSHVWAMLTLYQKDLPFVNKGQKVTISDGHELEQRSTINYISPIINEGTRTAKARVVLDNPGDLWKPGFFVSGSITTSETNVDLFIPKTALETIEGKTVVFVKDVGGFEPHEVKIGRTNHVNVEILDGLKAGDVFISKGGFTIKAELQKGEMGEGHGH